MAGNLKGESMEDSKNIVRVDRPRTEIGRKVATSIDVTESERKRIEEQFARIIDAMQHKKTATRSTPKHKGGGDR